MQLLDKAGCAKELSFSVQVQKDGGFRDKEPLSLRQSGDVLNVFEETQEHITKKI